MTTIRTNATEKILLRMVKALNGLLLLNDEDQRTGAALARKGLVVIVTAGATFQKAILTADGHDYIAEGRAKPSKTSKKAAPAPEAKRPVLVNILTGQRTVGEPGEDAEHLFERMFS